jgi:hypothetical protein
LLQRKLEAGNCLSLLAVMDHDHGAEEVFQGYDIEGYDSEAGHAGWPPRADA